MKNLSYLSFMLFTSLVCEGQLIVESVPAELSTDVSTQLFTQIEKFNAIQLNLNQLNQFVKRNKVDAKIRLKFSENQVWNITLSENNIKADNYTTIFNNENGTEKKNMSDVSCDTYSGYIDDDPKQYVRLYISDHLIKGVIFDKEKGYFHIEQIDIFARSTEKREVFIIYNEADAKKLNKYCANSLQKSVLADSKNMRAAASSSISERVIEVATDADLEWYNDHGSNSNADILSLMNIADGAYQSVFNLRLRVTYQSVWTSNSSPYPYSNLGILIGIGNARDFWNVNRQSIRRHLVVIFSSKNFGSYTGAVDQVGAVCTSPDKAYAMISDKQNPYTYQTLTHEIGHTLNAVHPSQSECNNPSVMCGGNGPSPNLNFSLSSQNLINSWLLNNGSCLNMIYGPDHLCPSGSYTLFTTNSSQINWSTSGNLNISSMSGNTLTVSNVGSGPGWVEASFSSNGQTVSLRKNLTVGAPEITQMVLNGNSIPVYSQNNVCTGSSNTMYTTITGGGSVSWQITNNTTSGVIYNASSNGATVSAGYATGGFLITLNLNNSCGSVQRQYPFYVSSCSINYKAYPNPARDQLTISFDDVQTIEDLPEIIELISENSKSISLSDKPKEKYKKNTLRDGNKIDFDVSKLARGIYYLRVRLNSGDNKNDDVRRIVLE